MWIDLVTKPQNPETIPLMIAEPLSVLKVAVKSTFLESFRPRSRDPDEQAVHHTKKTVKNAWKNGSKKTIGGITRQVDPA